MAESIRRLWLVRHGYRQDYTDPLWKRTAQYPSDPPLSAAGLIQAQDLVPRFVDESIEHIFVSPYLRTLQTIQPLAIAKKTDVSLKVEAGLGEIVSSIDPSPLGLSEAERCSPFPEIDHGYKSMWQPDQIETEESSMRRAAFVLEKILHQYAGNLLIVSHESPIRGMVRALTQPKQSVRCSFCGVTQLRQIDQIWHLISNGDVSHLSTPTKPWTFFMDYCRRQFLRL